MHLVSATVSITIRPDGLITFTEIWRCCCTCNKRHSSAQHMVRSTAIICQKQLYVVYFAEDQEKQNCWDKLIMFTLRIVENNLWHLKLLRQYRRKWNGVVVSSGCCVPNCRFPCWWGCRHCVCCCCCFHCSDWGSFCWWQAYCCSCWWCMHLAVKSGWFNTVLL